MARTSLLEHLEYFRRYAGDVAFVQHRGYRREQWKYGQVLDLAHQFAHELTGRGISKGDPVLIWGANSAEWVATFLGCMMQGVVAVPMDRIGAPEFTRQIFERLNARLIVASEELMPQVGEVPALPLERLSAVVAHHPRSPAYADLHRGDRLQIIFTSGTTTEPRGVVTTHGNVLANLEPFEPEIAKYKKYERLFHPLRFLETVPLSHVFGQMMGIFIPPLIGATVVFQDSLNPVQVMDTIRRERVSLLVAVPRLIEGVKSRLLRELEAEHEPAWLERQMALSAKEHFAKRWWRFRAAHNRLGWKFWAIVSGGATLDRATEETFQRMSFVVLQGYGLTESTSLISVNHPFARGQGSIGKTLPGRDMKLAADGEILVRGENIAAQYWQAGKLEPVVDEEGWFHTGDLGELDSEGYLHFKGRKKSVIVTPEGMKVYPEDVERVLRADPRVRDCVVFGINVGGNAETCAVLLLDSSSQLNAVVQAANERLAPHQRIRRQYAWPERDFPCTSTHKPKIAEIASATASALSSGSAEKASSPIAQALRTISTTAGQEDPTAEMNLTSIERVELMLALEERYHVQLNETAFAEAKSMKDVEQLVSTAEANAERTEYSYPRWQQRWPVTWIRLGAYYLLTWPATRLLARPTVVRAGGLAQLRGPALIVANHVTYVDVGFVLYALPPRMRHKLAVAMEGELLMQMLRPARELNIFMRMIYRLSYFLVVALFNVFPLPKLSGFRESFAFAGESADRGYNILVFPEGLRTRTGEMQPFRSGIGMLANGLKIPVVLIKLKGLYEVAQSGRRWARGGEIKVVVGEPVVYHQQSAEAIAADLERRVSELG